MYLVEGKEKAALLDTGTGIGSLKACVQKLTDKPVMVLLTHGHVDHAMGAPEFEEVYMNHKDDYIYKEHCSLEFRKAGLEGTPLEQEVTAADFIPEAPCGTFRDLKGGDAFDPVSYTHLDVYKRQDTGCKGHRGCLQYGERLCPGPVSYTHLDVYKRQEWFPPTAFPSKRIWRI